MSGPFLLIESTKSIIIIMTCSAGSDAVFVDSVPDPVVPTLELSSSTLASYVNRQ